MKKSITLALLMLLTLSSCSKNDASDNFNNSDFLVGTWEAVEEYDFYNGDGTFPYEEGEEALVFTKDRVSIYYDGDLTYTMEYKYNSTNGELISGSVISIIEKDGNNKFIWWNERKDLGSLYQRID